MEVLERRVRSIGSLRSIKSNWSSEEDFLRLMFNVVNRFVLLNIPRILFVEAFEHVTSDAAREGIIKAQTMLTRIPFKDIYHRWPKLMRGVWAMRGIGRYESELALNLLTDFSIPLSSFLNIRGDLNEFKAFQKKLSIIGLFNRKWYDLFVSDER